MLMKCVILIESGKWYHAYIFFNRKQLIGQENFYLLTKIGIYTLELAMAMRGFYPHTQG